MKKTKILVLALFLTTVAMAQQQNVATRSGKYTGVFGLFSNPASIAASPRRWDVSLFSINGGIGSDKLKFGMNTLTEKSEVLKEKLLAVDGDVSALINVEVTGPSFMMNINPKHAIGISSRTRIMGNISTMNAKLLQNLMDPEESKKLPYKLSTKDQVIAVNSWAEIGGSWGGVVFQKENHTIKAGATVKYLKGLSSSFANIQNLEATINIEKNGSQPEVYLTDGSGSVELINGGVDFFKDNLKTKDIVDEFSSSESTGIGFDLGVIYEYRDDVDESSEKVITPYKFKVGLSLLDLGSLKYTPNDEYAVGYTLNIPTGNKLYLNNLSGSFDEIRDYLNKSAYATKKEVGKTFTTSLPTTINVNVDYYIGSNFYAEAIGQFSLVNNDSKVQNPYYYNSFTLIPRFENKFLGAYLPFNYNTLSGFNLGVALRLGPLMIGSSSIFNQLVGEEHTQTDVFVGVRFGL